ncbi:MAG: hypothetical protein AAF333_01925 [Planctomycetota bacterium]
MASRSENGAWLFALFALVFGGWLVHGLTPPMACYLFGVEATATVTQYVPRQDSEGNTVHEHEFEYAGHTAIKRASKPYPVGHQRQVLYLPSRPRWMASGSRSDSLVTVLDKNTNGVGLAVVGGIVALSTFAAVASWREQRRKRRQRAGATEDQDAEAAAEGA